MSARRKPVTLDDILDRWDEHTDRSKGWGAAVDRQTDIMLAAPDLHWALCRASAHRYARRQTARENWATARTRFRGLFKRASA